VWVWVWVSEYIYIYIYVWGVGAHGRMCVYGGLTGYCGDAHNVGGGGVAPHGAHHHLQPRLLRLILHSSPRGQAHQQKVSASTCVCVCVCVCVCCVCVCVCVCVEGVSFS